MKRFNAPQRVTITFEGAMYSSLVEISQRTGVPVAELIRRQMAEFIDTSSKKKNDRTGQR